MEFDKKDNFGSNTASLKKVDTWAKSIKESRKMLEVSQESISISSSKKNDRLETSLIVKDFNNEPCDNSSNFLVEKTDSSKKSDTGSKSVEEDKKMLESPQESILTPLAKKTDRVEFSGMIKDSINTPCKSCPENLSNFLKSFPESDAGSKGVKESRKIAEVSHESISTPLDKKNNKWTSPLVADFDPEKKYFKKYRLTRHFRLFLPVEVGVGRAKTVNETVVIFLQEHSFSSKNNGSFSESLFEYSFVEFGLALILFSLFIKLALAPFHLWLLDVYEGVPLSSAFFFAVLTKLSIFVLLTRLCYNSFVAFKSCWQFYSLVIGLFSVFVGSFGGLKEKRLKALLAYSSISHMGYALVTFSMSTFLGIQMLLFYLFIYMLSGLSIWCVIVLLVLKKPRFEHKYSKELSDLTLLKKSNKVLAIALSLSIFSVAGIPPLVGFLAKLNVFLAVMGDSFYIIGLVTILCSIVSTFYYVRIIKVFYFESILIGKLYYPIKTAKTVLLGLLVFLLLFFFINPTFLYLINYKIILSLL